MQIHPNTFLHIVSKDGGTIQTLREFVLACRGGLDPEKDGVQIFTEQHEATTAVVVQSRRNELNAICNSHLLAADQLVLEDADGGVLQKIIFEASLPKAAVER